MFHVLPRDAYEQRGLYVVAKRLPVCLSVRLSHAGILSTPVNFFTVRSPTILLFFHTKHFGNIPTGTP